MNGNGNTRVLRSIVRALTADEFSREEYETALRMVRNGRLASVIEPILEALAGAAATDRNQRVHTGSSRPNKTVGRPKTESTGQLTVEGMFDLVKRRKVTRDGLLSILKDIDAGLVRNVTSVMTIREILKMAKSRIDSRDWDLLANIVSGKTVSDSYLDRILTNR